MRDFSYEEINNMSEETAKRTLTSRTGETHLRAFEIRQYMGRQS